MTPRELNEGVQFTVNGANQVTAVVLTPELWHKILRRLEEVEHLELAALLRERAHTGPLALASLRLRELSDDWA
ncbi:MAG TPA: hypothetical protein PKD53_31855 [Chloroflexaceae bacterium]|nr:hypothetical protein [Chloroflexaceae bacterium]